MFKHEHMLLLIMPKIFNNFNPELQLKNTEFWINNKLKRIV